ncbi:hypothetical protein FANTH_12863 [Fusarium anthophilum]|uniref:Reverse transcriptase n=1 Tax=Fusarium anthophilum TaxID=48485 RepID=A0A8H4YQX4_9HYPO|nr:hypothetical protein FANTH_12863 [Fusarium anthophilum]
MATLLRDPDIGQYDILAIQEPWTTLFDTTTHHPAKDQFHLCYPDKDESGPARVCFFINKRFDHSRWHFKEASRDLCSLNLVLGTEEGQQIMVHNVYNPTQTATERRSTLPLLSRALEQSSQHEQIVVGTSTSITSYGEVTGPSERTPMPLNSSPSLKTTVLPATLPQALSLTKQQANTPNKKAELLKKTFLLVLPETDLEDIENADYPAAIAMPPITPEIKEAIEESFPLKALGPDGITNKALQIASPWIKKHLTKTFNRSLTLGYYPKHFRQSTTVVLRKSGKDNYTVPKAYRPIALLNTTGKVMEAVTAKRLSYIAETHDLLPATHMGGRKLRYAKHALHHIIDKIYDA